MCVLPAHWVGHSQLISLYKDDFFKRTPGVDEKQAIITGNTAKQLVSGRKNPVLLQQGKENVYEKTNDDADVNEESNEMNDKRTT